MPNDYKPQYNTANLTPFKQVWNDKTTKTIRVPVALAEAVLEYARTLDNGEAINPSPDNLSNPIAAIVAKVNQKAPGYRANSASQLIKDLKTLTDIS